MRAIDRLTEGDRERDLLQRLRTGRVAAVDVERECLPFFTKLQVQTATHCNAACSTCPHPQVTRALSSGQMTEDLYERILRQLPGRGVERISPFLMNEPLVDKRLPRLVRRTREVVPEAEVTIITNGQLLDARRAVELAEAGMGEITVSVNGFERGAYGAVMVGLDFDAVVANLEALGRLRAAGDLGSMRVQVSALELGDAAERADAFEQRVGLPVFLRPVSNRAGAVDAQALRAGGCALSDRPAVCQRPFVKAYVLFDGRMVLCNSDWWREEIIGDVAQRSLEDLWHDARLMQIRRNHIEGRLPAGSPCARCDYPRLAID
ncbi:radical SAM/SPASM domain-containing protein [Engelhardtia mirabilis]|uniref:S-adenosyl-L-methionine-dependent 2-deoxy-scyllo-inosamine dehydrogenase n=1 Tax=Engelhardtia mirabilis TaxID=2528011 RepID=A0A518BF91_9BACT|nr:S-adenosyl-L-methionine-dependent 2-deoxy-scyllo-inosamine dehydrogenase [Planctomycetes bacterium Pla133]QDU99975.1 S-adenosyl-L-methionine-dependent 2-deoxy-scyllo-inosamine dehydrogenase [Planctomycetes bacterium Pla86]